MMSKTEPKVFVIGLDGATFDLIEPWVKEGKLPNLAKIMKEGVHGELESTIPPITQVACSSFMTGMNPGKHGIFRFVEGRYQSHRLRPVNRSSLRARPFWSILSESGKRVGLINVPITYPPEEINGFIVSGLDIPEGEGSLTYPPGLYQEITNKVGKYTIDIDRREISLGGEQFIQGLLDMVQGRLETALYLKKNYEWDLFAVVFAASDWAQHYFWKNIDPDHSEYAPNNNAVLRIYQKLDEAIEKLIRDLDEETVLIILSDHGAGPLYKGVSLNGWLKKHHYLSHKRLSYKEKLARMSILAAFGLKSKVWGFLPEKVRAVLKREIRRVRGKVPLRNFLSNIDWNNTQAFSDGVTTIEINVEGRDPNGIVKPGEEYENLRNQIIDQLTQLTDPETNKRVVDRAYKGEELYHGEHVKEAPDLVIMWREGYRGSVEDIERPELGMKKGKNSLFETPHRRSGTHKLNGTLFLKGKGIKKNVEIEGARIIDLAPTILYLMNHLVPADMDGRVLKEAFENGYLASNKI